MRILLATSRYPWPPRRGDQIRTVQALDFLATEHEVTLLTPEPGPGQPPPPEDIPCRIEHYRPGRGAAVLFGLARAILKGHPLQNGLFYQADLGRRLRELAPQADLGILQLVRLGIHLEDFGDTPLLVDLIDSLSLNVSLRAQVDSPWLRPALKIEARLLEKAERRLAERAGGMVVVCERDRESLASRLPPELAAKVSVVRLAVPGWKAEPVLAEEPEDRLLPEGDGRPVLVMTGNLGYFVNVDAVTWWLREVWPPLRRLRPGIQVVIAGDRPAAAVRRAVADAGGTGDTWGGSGVRLIESPRDLRSVLSQATLALAPMRCGSGVPVKILEAWAAGVPVVASAWAAAGTSGLPGEDFRLAGPNPVDWVRTLLDLLGDPATRQHLADNGRRRLETDYSRQVACDQLLEAVQRARQ